MKKIIIPYVTERIWAITPPDHGILYIISHDEVFKVDINNGIKVENLDEEPYDFCEALPNCLGIPDGSELHNSFGNVIEYDFDPILDSVCVRLKINGEEEEVYFPTLSGDWFSASFSTCGKYIVLAEPYSFEVYEL